MESVAPHPGFFAASGTGKTRMGALKLLTKAIQMGTVSKETWAQWNQTPYMMVCAPTYKMLRKVLIPTYLQLCPKELIDGDFRWTDSYLPLRNGIDIWFASAEDASLLYGPTLLSWHLDEACRMDEEVWDVMTFRLRGPLPPGVPGPRQGIVTGTPYGLPHWTYDQWGDPQREDRSDPLPVTNAEDYPWWNMTMWENPYQSPQDLARWAAKYGDSPMGRQEMRGQWVAEGEGRLFQDDWFGRFDHLPENIFRIVDSWDTAGTKNEWSSWTVGQTWAITTDYNYYLLNMFRAKMEYPDVKRAIRENAKFLYGKRLNMPRAILIENKGNGQTALQELRLERLPVIAYNPGRDKHDRATQASIAVDAGRVFLPSKSFAADHKLTWVRDFEREVFSIPYAGSWDIVDAMTQFILWAEVNRWQMRPEDLGPIAYQIGLEGPRVRV